MRTLPVCLLVFLAAVGTVEVWGSNEVGAFLVYPLVLGGDDVETYLTVTNAGPLPVNARLSFINGSSCAACGLSVPLNGNDTESLVFTTLVSGTGQAQLMSEDDSLLSVDCAETAGFVTVHLEDDGGTVVTDNVLLGEQVVVNYLEGVAYSVPAIPFNGVSGAVPGNLEFDFDDVEYSTLSRSVGFDYATPGGVTDTELYLALFTLGFQDEVPPGTQCTVTAFDPGENELFTMPLELGCWTLAPLTVPFAVTPGPLGMARVECTIDTQCGDGTAAAGGVHGAIVQTYAPVSPTASRSASASLLYSSVSTGDAVTFSLEDTDGDGLGNLCDDDDDNDGVPDVDDQSRLDPDFCEDLDPDGCDDCAIGTDDFGPLSDSTPLNDGPDADSDGLCDSGDPCPFDATNTDTDGDGLCDDGDGSATPGDNPCPPAAVAGAACDDNCRIVPNSGQEDLDEDGIGNLCDPDNDNDGVPDVDDSSRLDPDVCEDREPDGCDDCAIGTDDFGPLSDSTPLNDGPDADSDGLCDSGDPCPFDATNTDTDGDGLCDDGDGSATPGDNPCPPAAVAGAACDDNCRIVSNSGQEDLDEDGIGNICDDDFFSISTDGVIQGSYFRRQDVLQTPIGGGPVSLYAAVVPRGLGLDALDVQADGKIVFSTARTGGVSHAGGFITLRHPRLYLFDPDTGVITPLAEAEGLDLRDLDAVDQRGDAVYFSTATRHVAYHTGGTITLRHENVYRYRNGEISLFFDGKAFGLRSLIALEIGDENDQGGRLLGFSTAVNQFFPGVGTMRHRNAYGIEVDSVGSVVSGAPVVVLDGEAAGIPDLDACTLGPGIE